ncbi:MAG TPA: SPOR domain-containing protein [Rectinemataceae bacterium]|nr:SPOR domain-containing protein [Rectinemataceae bacterium]
MAENSRKLLWLAAAVSLFVLVVVGAAFLIFAPGKSAEQVPLDLTGKAEPRQDNPQDFLADTPSDPSTTQTTSSGDIIIVYGNDPSGQPSSPAEAAKPATTTIYVTPSETPTTVAPTATPKTAPATPATTPAVAPKTVQKAPSAAPAPAKTPAPAAPASKPATTTAAKAPAQTTKAAPSVQPSTGDYWIQAGSFSVKANADSLKGAFSEKSLPAVITVKDIDGKSRYNVRVGPYATRSEASKWLSAAKSVKGAEQAWITQ